MKKLLNWSNLSTVILGLLVVALLVSPKAKALMIQGLMKVGFFRPPTATDGSGSRSGFTSIDLTLISADGTSFNVAHQKGKVIVLNFWATWCPPCIAEMPSIDKLAAQFKGNTKLLIVPIDVDGDFAKSIAFMKHKGYSLPVYNIQSDVPRGLVGDAIPTTVIIDKTGRVAARHDGAADYSDPHFTAFINDLLSAGY
jgi:thiol-disulfide isomerase/thioredoxin